MNKINPPIFDKKSIRQCAQEAVQNLSTEEKRSQSRIVCEYVKKIILQEKPETLVTYIPLSDEVDISSIPIWFASYGKVVTVDQTGAVGAFKNDKSTLVLIPGRAFTQDGNRLGRGSGYYDQFLEKNKNIQTLGICFDCQVVENIPEETWDRRVNTVVFTRNTLE